MGRLGVSADGRLVESIAVVTGSRAEYGLLKPIMEEIRAIELELRLVVTGMHLRPEFGDTYREIEADGFTIDAKVEMAAPGDDYAAMVQSIGVGVSGIGRALESINPDVVVVLGDRIEAFAAAIAGAGLNRVVAHIHGGEVTRGGLDESMRHAITKLAHLHFAATEKSRERIIKMGEDADRVFTVGAPGLDSVLRTNWLEPSDLEREVGIPLRRPLVVLVQHSVSTAAEKAAAEIRETLEAVRQVGHQTICLYPNSDAGGQRMIEVIESYRGQPWLHILPNLDHVAYLSLLRCADVLVGNTSSGIIEAPSFYLPVVNIGERQAGRERSNNILDVPPRREDIKRAIDRALGADGFRAAVRACSNPYGDGKASTRIVDVLRRVRITHDLLQKQLAY